MDHHPPMPGAFVPGALEGRQLDAAEPHLRRFLALRAELAQLAQDGQAEAHHGGDIDLDGFFVLLRERLDELEARCAELLARADWHGAAGVTPAPTDPGDSRGVASEDDLVTEQSLESFPASDPPGNF